MRTTRSQGIASSNDSVEVPALRDSLQVMLARVLEPVTRTGREDGARCRQTLAEWALVPSLHSQPMGLHVGELETRRCTIPSEG